MCLTLLNSSLVLLELILLALSLSNVGLDLENALGSLGRLLREHLSLLSHAFMDVSLCFTICLLKVLELLLSCTSGGLTLVHDRTLACLQLLQLRLEHGALALDVSEFAFVPGCTVL